MAGYDHKKIEEAAQAKWAELAIGKADLENDPRDPYYLLVEFPYPSGDLHTGHWYAYALPDIYARYLRMKGDKNVLFPIGFDAFGLPAENAAMKHGLDPKEWTYKNMERMRSQIRSIGTSFDWSKEVITCEPSYYKWTQWLFTKLLEHNLAYRKKAAVKWCPKDQTVLANEQVDDGRCSRCGTEVVERILTQWFLKITDFAERLLTDLDPLPWREEIKEAQRAWIGKSEGAKITFAISGSEEGVEVFTTRPETVFGATYVVLAPEHPLIPTLLTRAANASEVEAYVEKTKKKSERERSENKEKTGVQIEGVSVLNPATKEEIPLYLADYVLPGYGTGAVMAVPAHDERDFEFAKVMNLPIKDVLMPVLPDVTNPQQPGKPVVHRRATISIVYDPKKDAYLCLKWKTQPWTTFVSGGVEEGEDPADTAMREIAEETGYTNVRLIRKLGGDAQAEFYAAHKGENRVAQNSMYLFELVDETQAEIEQSEKDRYDIVWIPKKKLAKTKIQHSEAELIRTRIETGMDAFMGGGILVDSGEFSGKGSEETKWDIVTFVGGVRTTNYRLRDWLVSRQRYWGCPIPIVYDPQGNPQPIPAEHLPWLLPTDVDFTPHGEAPLASSKELKERVTRIFGEGFTPEYDTLDTFVDSSWYFLRYVDPHNEHAFSSEERLKQWLPVDRYSGGSEHTTMHLLYARFFQKALCDLALVRTSEPFVERFNRGIILGPDGQKMSKSKGNVINPDEFVAQYGADSVRVYLGFIGPYYEPGSYPWKLEGVASMRKFLDRVANAVHASAEAEVEPKLTRGLALAVPKVGTDIERFKFNTAIAALMTLLNEVEAASTVPKAVMRDYVRMLAPFAPHLGEHLWEQLGGEGSVHLASWPALSVMPIGDDLRDVVVQVVGKRRGIIQLSATTTEEDALAHAITLPAVSKAIGGRPIARVVYLPGKILNIVLGS